MFAKNGHATLAIVLSRSRPNNIVGVAPIVLRRLSSRNNSSAVVVDGMCTVSMDPDYE